MKIDRHGIMKAGLMALDTNAFQEAYVGTF